jgi:hypothetical protein
MTAQMMKGRAMLMRVIVRVRAMAYESDSYERECAMVMACESEWV